MRMFELSQMQTCFSPDAKSGARPIFIGLASIEGNDAEAAVLREALEDRGAAVHDWPLNTRSPVGLDAPEIDVLLVTAKMFDSRLSTLIQDVGRQASPYLIVLSESGDVVDRILALELGADDFLRRESDPREILARAKCLMRRDAQRDGRPLSHTLRKEAPSWILNDVSRLLCSPGGTVCELSRRDIELIDALVDEPSDVLSMEKDSAEANGLRMSISRLRRKFRKVSTEDLPIRNIWGVGYAFEAPLKRVSSRA